MEPARHLEILRTEGARIAALPVDALNEAIPTNPEWDIERLVRHVGKVHRWCTAALALPADAAMADTGPIDGLPKGPDCLPAYAEAHHALVAAIEASDPDDAKVTFMGPGDVAWWTRRQALEVVVHRVDAQDAVAVAGGPSVDAIDVDAAADGIDEWARFFLAVRWSQRFGALPAELVGRSIHIHGTDDPDPIDGAEWLLAFGPDGIDVTATHAKGDVALRGSTHDLLLTLWRRRPLDTLDVIGDADLAAQVLDLARF